MTSDNNDDGRLTADAQPTKDFFVSMLVRDVDLLDAVIDLLDNSVDGARRLRDNNDYTGLTVELNFDASKFKIVDNCGGIPLEVAKHYAFRFGRDSTNPADPHSIGQFGVGMKRTLFKLGQRFSIASKTADSQFALHVVVPEWLAKNKWNFEISTNDDPMLSKLSSTGTVIEVSDLAPSAADSLADPSWANRLAAAARLKHRRAIDRGLVISINSTELERMPLDLRSGQGVEPALEHLELLDGTVLVTLLAGLSVADPSAAGWYVFCNDRLVLGPDRTSATVWRGAGRQARGGVPNYHDQYSEFRGYALFEANDPSLLPWTTTKTGVDTDNAAWRATRPSMERLTRPIIDFLNQLDKERTALQGDGRRGQAGVLDDESELRADLASKAVQDSPRTHIDELISRGTGSAISQDFAAPDVDLQNLPTPKVWIRYAAEASEVATARRLMGGESVRELPNSEVGRRAFDYYLDNESD